MYDFDAAEFDSNDSDIRSLTKGDKIKLLRLTDEVAWVEVQFLESEKINGLVPREYLGYYYTIDNWGWYHGEKNRIDAGKIYSLPYSTTLLYKSEQILDGMKPGTFMVRRNRHHLSHWRKNETGLVSRDSGFRISRVEANNVRLSSLIKPSLVYLKQFMHWKIIETKNTSNTVGYRIATGQITKPNIVSLIQSMKPKFPFPAQRNENQESIIRQIEEKEGNRDNWEIFQHGKVHYSLV